MTHEACLGTKPGRLALLLAALAVCGSSPAWATWTSVGALMVGNSIASSSTLVVATSAALEAGNVGVCAIAKDESGTGTTDGDNLQVLSITDTAGNKWWRGPLEHCNMQTSTAANGACSDIWYTQATTTLASGQNITINFIAANTSKAATCQEFTVTAGNIVARGAPAGAPNGLSNAAADPGSMTNATGVTREHLFVRATACESNVTTFTTGSNFTAFDGSTTTSTANTGTAGTSMGARAHYRIATEATSAASDPTHAAVDCASTIVALDESPPIPIALMGVGQR